MILSDEEILVSLAANVDGHFDKVVIKYTNGLKRFVLSKIRNYEDAEDIIMITFERALEALRDYPEQRIQNLKLRAWLYKIAQHTFLNYRERFLKAEEATIPLDTSKDRQDDDHFSVEIKDDEWKEPQVIVENEETRREIETLIHRLPEIYCEPVRLYFLEELSYQEIADRLQLQIGTIRVQIHRGRSILRRLLDDKDRR